VPGQGYAPRVLRFVLTAVFVVGCLVYIVIRYRRKTAASHAALGPSAARTTGTIVSVQTRVPDLRSPEGPLLPLNFHMHGAVGRAVAAAVVSGRDADAHPQGGGVDERLVQRGPGLAVTRPRFAPS